MDLRGKSVLVTGASSGIGQAIAIACAEKGAMPIIHYRGNKDGAERTLQSVSRFGDAHLLQADLTDPGQIAAMFDEINGVVGPLDCLVNNAGQATPGDFFDKAHWRFQFDNILFSMIETSQHFLQQQSFPAHRRKIINIGSVYGNQHTGNPAYIAYSVAKSAVASFSINLAKLNPQVLVNAIAPGYVWTPPWEGMTEADKQHYESRTQIGRFIDPSEIAQMAVALLENDAMTGQVITVDGGLELRHDI